MKALVEHHTADTAKAGRQQALRIDSAAIGHSLLGQTSPMLYLVGEQRSYCYWPIFKKIRRRFAVFP